MQHNNVSDFQGLRFQSKKREDTAVFSSSFKSETRAPPGGQPAGDGKKKERDRLGLSKRFLEGGTQWEHVVQLAETWFVPLMRECIGCTTTESVLAASKEFCDSTSLRLEYLAQLRAPRVKKPVRPTLQQELASAPSETDAIKILGTLPWVPKMSPINKKL